MLFYINLILLSLQWLNLVNLYIRLSKKTHFRRWWVKLHLKDGMRDLFGAYDSLLIYFYNEDHKEFVRMTRMTPCDFEKLHEIVGPSLRKMSLRRPLPTRLRLLLTLNFLAHGDSVRTTQNFFRVGRSTVHSIVGEVCPIIWDVLSPQILKRTRNDWKITAGGFRVLWDCPNCVGALDGKEIRIKTPPELGSLFYNYKKFFSFKLFAACDASYQFTWVDIEDYGSVSDLSIFRETEFFRALENGDADLPPSISLPRSNIELPYFFVGDENFPLAFSRRQKNYNARISRARDCIEAAFGILVGRWQI